MCNLLTGEQVIVDQLYKPSCSVEIYGLGQCPISNRFKVLRILNTNGSHKYVAEIQTLGTNEWRTVGDSPQFHSKSSGAFLDGWLHRYSYRDNCIWAFHFGEEKFSAVVVPDGMKRGHCTEVSVFDSQLCFSSITMSCRQCDVCVRRNTLSTDSWMKLFVFQVESLMHRIPLVMKGKREVIVSYYNSVNHGVCGTESGRCKRVRVPGISSYKVITCNPRFYKL